MYNSKRLLLTVARSIGCATRDEHVVKNHADFEINNVRQANAELIW